MILGIGVDTVEIARFQRFIDEGNQGLLDRLFSPAEQAYCAPRKQAAASYAARFAAKEALVKALGTGLRDGLSWTEIEVRSTAAGKPELHLSGCSRQIFEERGATVVHLSLSHDGGNAVAMVVLETA
ncbi:holo-[acyl-carrier-protein] synthase [Trichlorobacter ammonificans]|uniref:Holo-[acyl-carrier-protein] synthase n=1 Tax=Trichlorobacter ammonificans TaxID=2916410 RepID=A0ABM9D8L5_9BACT|nr:holo-[acyl-carrier-protein] synthase [Trichlorobacter ammonificans]CAH2031445.1 Holo-[acyl-carrier-protein] synthase [Trichlorobacter ammonificans]